MFFRKRRNKNLSVIVLATEDKSGVTMMETVVALGILVLGIITALTLMISSISFSQSTEQRIVAINLAREGIEMVRSIRDLNGFESLIQNSHIVKINPDNSLELETVLGEIANCSTCSLYIYNGRYTHNSDGELTAFKRMLTITNLSDSEKQIISQVYWTEKGRAHDFELETNLTEW